MNPTDRARWCALAKTLWPYPLWPYLVALLAAAGITTAITVTDDDGDGRPDRATFVITTKVNAAPGDGRPTTALEVPKAAVDAAAPKLEDDLKDETPADAPAAAIDKVQAQVDEVRKTEEPLPTAGATAGFPGCRASFVVNQSSRRGVRPIYQVLHYTVSPNRPGWSDVDAIVALFNRPSSQASSHFVIDREGHCAYIVPIEAKAWTEAAGNPLSVAYEIVNSGSEGSFMDSAGYAKLKSVMAEVTRRTGIPSTAGDVATGRPGAVQHKDGGLAWGGHHDIEPYSKLAVIAKVQTRPCGTRCRRAADLRKRHRATHTEIRRRNCAPLPRTRSARCRTLDRRNAALHAAARRAGAAL